MRYTVPTKAEKVAAIQEKYQLDGERVILRGRTRADGSPWVLKGQSQKDGDCMVSVTAGHRRTFSIHYHRIKFLLLHGWLPEQVCRRDGILSNTHSSNLIPWDVPPGGPKRF